MEHRTVLHIDMNAFFASVEQANNPELRGKPIAVVVGHGRTVITTSSYEARAKGVKTGMAIWEGKRTCPELIIVVGDNRKYTHTSTKINEIFRDYTPEVEAFSIDESWLDARYGMIDAAMAYRFFTKYPALAGSEAPGFAARVLDCAGGDVALPALWLSCRRHAVGADPA